ncbi:MAG: glycosyltransferase [Sulfitobacter sp.]|jgi:glycosyltransferase involved in cell wall biosynthesis|nr:glycosyltransferase [Sulfitobacter sp.]
MAPLPHITVLMGTRNGGAFLRSQLASLAAQDHPHWSLWISDDGSTDGTRALIRAFAQDQPNPVMLLRGPQQGMTANYLGLLCHPDLPPGPVAFADQDDLWLPHHLTRGLTALAQDSTSTPAGQVYCAHRMLLRDGQAPRAMRWRGQAPATFRNALVECRMPGSGLMLDATAVALARSVGMVDAPFWDCWLILLLTGAGTDVLQDARPGLFYRAHAGNHLGPRAGLRAALWRMNKLRDGTYRNWVCMNLATLEPHMNHLTLTNQSILRHALSLAPGPRLRQLSTYRHWRRDRLALWLAA